MCECVNCDGGAIPVGGGIHVISWEMAMDAGMPEIEGQQVLQEPDWHMCPCCFGDYEQCVNCENETCECERSDDE